MLLSGCKMYHCLFEPKNLNLISIWKRMIISCKDLIKWLGLQAMMFPEGVYFDREMEGYRTQRVNGFFALSNQIQQFLVEKEKGKSDQNIHFSLSVVRRGIATPTGYSLLSIT
jgi:hypothetical protein